MAALNSTSFFFAVEVVLRTFKLMKALNEKSGGIAKTKIIAAYLVGDINVCNKFNVNEWMVVETKCWPYWAQRI